MAFYGQDVAQVKQLGTQLKNKAGDIETAMNALNKQVNGVEWKGPDADKFKNEWNSTHVAKLKQVITALRDAGTAAQRNATEQEQTSSKF